jgi:NAD(P)H-hydrate repair Nnr-like enzyme with NAD(P)H-hydrate epimerase domain
VKKTSHHRRGLHPEPPDKLGHVDVVVDALVGVGIDGHPDHLVEVAQHVHPAGIRGDIPPSYMAAGAGKVHSHW